MNLRYCPVLKLLTNPRVLLNDNSWPGVLNISAFWVNGECETVSWHIFPAEKEEKTKFKL